MFCFDVSTRLSNTKILIAIKISKTSSVMTSPDSYSKLHPLCGTVHSQRNYPIEVCVRPNLISANHKDKFRCLEVEI